MKKLSEYSVNYPVTIIMMVLAILLLGYISFDKLGMDIFPDLNNPRIFIELQAGEKPPEEMESKFVEDIESILKSTPKEKSMLLFSATMPRSILNIAKRYMREYDFIEVEKSDVLSEPLRWPGSCQRGVNEGGQVRRCSFVSASNL